MAKDIRIQSKIVLPLFLSLSLLLGISSIFMVRSMRMLSWQNVEMSARDIARINAGEIEQFFTERGRVVTTLFEDPFVIGWFSGYHQFRAPVENDPGYKQVTQYFINLVESDSTIKSAYFATDNTQEYFYEAGRYEEDGYFVKNRTWWHHAVDAGRLYCEIGDFDVLDSTLSASMQMPVYLETGRLLGVGGIDILISTVGKIVSRIKYKNHGQAFLMDNAGRIIYFSGLNESTWLHRNLAELDSVFSSAAGFTTLRDHILQERRDLIHVVWQDQDCLALITPVRSDLPYIDWTLTILVPQDEIFIPINRITMISSIVIVCVIAAIMILTWIILSRTVKPLNHLALRLDEMANRQSDLTRELPVETRDVIGRTARNFNKFIRQIRTLLIRIIGNANDVVSWVSKIRNHASDVSVDVQDMSTQITHAACTSKQMLENVEIMVKGVQRVTALAAKSNESVSNGEALMQFRMEQLRELVDNTCSLLDEMTILHDKTESVVQTTRLIDDINEQASLLSVNASIEAVSAGDAGKGFTVVAREIRSLSEQTANANSNIANQLNEFHGAMRHFENQIKTIQAKIDEEHKSTVEVFNTFQTLKQDVSNTSISVDAIRTQTTHQLEAIHQFDEHIQQISEATMHISREVSASFEEVTQVDKRVQELKKSIEIFKIDEESSLNEPPAV